MMEFHEGQLTNKDERIIRDILMDLTDIYGDFYITRNNLRLFIKENQNLLFDCIKKGDKIVYEENEGIIFATGWSDKSKRKYIKVLAKDEKSADNLLKVINWNMPGEKFFAKIKKNNPLRRVLQKNNFTFAGDRGKEILLIKEYIFSDTKAEEKEKIIGDKHA